MLWQITSPRFVAGLISEDDIVVRAAPILRWTINQNIYDIARCVDNSRWRMAAVIPFDTDRGVRGQ